LPAVNVVATGTDVTLATQLPYPKSSDYVPVPGGTYDLVITLADTGEQVATITGVVLTGNMVYELVIMGEPGDDNHPVTITPLEDTTATRDGATPAAATPAAATPAAATPAAATPAA
jgi:hypothetical protein